MRTGHGNFNLRDGDSGKYDVPEGYHVYVMICSGYKSKPGDNCDGYRMGIA